MEGSPAPSSTHQAAPTYHPTTHPASAPTWATSAMSMCKLSTWPTRGSSHDTNASAVSSSSSRGRRKYSSCHSAGDRLASRHARHTSAARTLRAGGPDGGGPVGRRRLRRPALGALADALYRPRMGCWRAAWWSSKAKRGQGGGSSGARGGVARAPLGLRQPLQHLVEDVGLQGRQRGRAGAGLGAAGRALPCPALAGTRPGRHWVG